MESIITSKTLREIQFLLMEHMGQHRSPDMPEYNQCDTAPCNWCERAKKVLEELAPKPEPHKKFLMSIGKDTLLVDGGNGKALVGEWVQLDGGGTAFQETDEL